MNRKTLVATLVAASLAPVAASAATEVIETYNLPATTYYVETAPATTYYVVYESPPIVVEAPALTADQAINNDVIDRLAGNPRLTGRIGVETYDRNVELTGVVTNPRQAELAERDARSVSGVRSVQNDLRTRLSR